MHPAFKRWFPPLLVLALGLAAFLTWLKHRSPTLPPAASDLSVLAERPDWSKLEIYQNTISRVDFERLLTTVFTTGQGWRRFIEIDDQEARIRTGNPAPSDVLHLRFIPPGSAKSAPHHWRSAADLPPAPAGKPLSGLRVAIDPGHIGGRWADIEERRFVSENAKPVCEGDMTLQVAKLLKPRLEALGATVSLVRSKAEPVTTLRPDSLMETARSSGEPADTPAALKRTAERLFYRTAEIHARAKLVNQTLKPDLVLCLHFNAESWGDSSHPDFVSHTHMHLLVNGAYDDTEVALTDQRFAMLSKILSGAHEEESRVGATVAEVFAAKTHLSPFAYSPHASNARPVNGSPYVWARNLLANRLYDCPVIFLEPYVMNSTIDYPRIQAGDYDGLRKVDGKSQPSIFREYADSLAEALAKHYSEKRGAKR